MAIAISLSNSYFEIFYIQSINSLLNVLRKINMKKIFFVVLSNFLITQVMAGSSEHASVAPALQAAIKAYGYRCDKVDLDSIVPFSWSGKRGYHIYCNEYQYGYEVEDKGGKIVVTVK
jgi:hypothetical protein